MASNGVNDGTTELIDLCDSSSSCSYNNDGESDDDTVECVMNPELQSSLKKSRLASESKKIELDDASSSCENDCDGEDVVNDDHRVRSDDENKSIDTNAKYDSKRKSSTSLEQARSLRKISTENFSSGIAKTKSRNVSERVLSDEDCVSLSSLSDNNDGSPKRGSTLRKYRSILRKDGNDSSSTSESDDETLTTRKTGGYSSVRSGNDDDNVIKTSRGRPGWNKSKMSNLNMIKKRELEGSTKVANKKNKVLPSSLSATANFDASSRDRDDDGQGDNFDKEVIDLMDDTSQESDVDSEISDCIAGRIKNVPSDDDSSSLLSSSSTKKTRSLLPPPKDIKRPYSQSPVESSSNYSPSSPIRKLSKRTNRPLVDSPEVVLLLSSEEESSDEEPLRSDKLHSDSNHTEKASSIKPSAKSSFSTPRKNTGNDDVLSISFASPSSLLLTPVPISLNESTINKYSQNNAEDTGTTSAVTSGIASNRSVTDDTHKRMIKTPSLPLLNTIGGKLYPDLRHHFIRALVSNAQKNRHASAQRFAFDATLRAIVVLSLRSHPIRSPDAARRIKGVGSELHAVLKEAAKQCPSLPYAPPRGKFSTTAPAVLVALLEYENENPEDPLCTVEDLLVGINSLVDCRHVKLVRPTDYYLDKDTIDPEWGQVRKLCTENVHAGLSRYIKERKKKDKAPSGIVFELLQEGREVAKRLKCSAEREAVGNGPLRQLAASFVDKDYGNVTMCVDFREGGGGMHSLHKMCDLLDDHLVPFVVRELKISDYIFFVGNKLAPILIERKSVDDVANSLADGRWKRQQHAMRKAQYVLGGGSERRCQMCFLIEGDASRRTVHGGNVGRHSWNQSLEDVENAINDLPSLGFSVMRSKSHMGSMMILAKVARDVSWKAKNGSIDAMFTYEEFLRRVKECDEKEGLPPVLDQHKNPATPVVESVSIRSEPTNPLRNDLDNSPLLNAKDQVEDEIGGGDGEDNASSLQKLSSAELKEKCKDRFEKASGPKKELIARLLKPRKPEVIISRLRQGQYVPKILSCNAALMVALLLNHRPGSIGLTKENLMMYAEETGVSKDPMGGNGGFYDGWAGMKDLTSGDPALIFVVKKRYSLTTNPAGSAGVDVANGLHILAHRESLCRCGNHMLG